MAPEQFKIDIDISTKKMAQLQYSNLLQHPFKSFNLSALQTEKYKFI